MKRKIEVPDGDVNDVVDEVVDQVVNLFDNDVVDEVVQSSDEVKQQLEDYEFQKKEEVAQKLAESKANLESKSKDNPYTIEELYDSKYYKEAIHYRITTCFYASRYFLNETEFLSSLYRGCEDIEACMEKSRFYFEAIKQSAAKLTKRERLFIINVVNDSLVEAMRRLNDEKKNREAQSKLDSKVESKEESNVELVEDSKEDFLEAGPGPKVVDSVADSEAEEKNYDYGTYEDSDGPSTDEARKFIGDYGSIEYTDSDGKEVVLWYSWVKDSNRYSITVDDVGDYKDPQSFYTYIKSIEESSSNFKLNRI